MICGNHMSARLENAVAPGSPQSSQCACAVLRGHVTPRPRPKCRNPQLATVHRWRLSSQGCRPHTFSSHASGRAEAKAKSSCRPKAKGRPATLKASSQCLTAASVVCAGTAAQPIFGGNVNAAETAAAVTDAAGASAGALSTASNSSCSGLGCAQELLDAFGRPFTAIADSLPSSSLLPTLLVVLSAGAAAAWRFAVYSRREYIVAATVGKYVPKGGASVIQINGTTRDVYYYPKGTVSVKVVGSSVRPALMEQAGASAAVPVEARKQTPTDLSFQGTGTLDAVVAFNALKDVGSEAEQYLAEVTRVLKPGGPFIFFDRVEGEGLAAAAQLVVGNIFSRVDESALQQLRKCSGLVDVTGDIVLKGQDPHAVGVAFKSGAGGKAGRETDMTDTFKEPSWLRKGSKKPSSSRKSKGFARK